MLSKGYRIPSADIAEALRLLMNGANVVVNRPAAEAGLAQLEAGGDFADGVIAFEGTWLARRCLSPSTRRSSSSRRKASPPDCCPEAAQGSLTRDLAG